ncbi:peptidylprolyl isomerase [Thalassotalea aquiviva]|uniref:peptidylprolyl isomerase n=1 Tax=Thalassotalea aquiviva TaxID=3242415 RepID=UPI00352A07F8
MKSFVYKLAVVYVFALLALFFGRLLNDDPATNTIKEFIVEQKIDKSKPNWKSNLPKPPLLDFSAGKDYFWQLKTNKGTILIKLMPEYAPMHVSSTIYLTSLGFYDELTFHRVIPGFMAQGGDPEGTGRGNPGYRYDGEFHEEASHDQAGILSMANAGPGTDGSQFFITFKPTRFLDGRHTVFGQVVKGMDTLNRLESFGTKGGKPTEKLMILKAKILNRKPE